MAQYIVKSVLAGQKEQRIAFEKLFADEMAKKATFGIIVIGCIATSHLYYASIVEIF